MATLTLGGAGAHATYYHKANDQVIDINRRMCLPLSKRQILANWSPKMRPRLLELWVVVLFFFFV